MRITESGTEAANGGIGIQQCSDNDNNNASDNKSCYPHDTFSFIGNPNPKPLPFLAGLTVFILQVFLLVFFIIDETRFFDKWTSGAEHDDSEHHFLPANVEPLPRAAQYLSIIVYIAFSDGAMEEITTAVDFFRLRQAWQMRLSCLLRFLLGTLAVAATTLLVMTSGRVRDAVLNIIAVEFVSQFDDMAFALMRNGRYLASLRHEANKIADEPLPDEYAKSYHDTSVKKLAVTFLVLIATLIPMGIYNYRQNKDMYVVNQF